jgi:hypothetical protein
VLYFSNIEGFAIHVARVWLPCKRDFLEFTVVCAVRL